MVLYVVLCFFQKSCPLRNKELFFQGWLLSRAFHARHAFVVFL